MSHIADQLLALAQNTGAPDVVEDAAHMLKSLEGVRAERDILQEIVDEQRAQIAQLVRRIEELTQEVASVTDERRHAVAALSEQVDTMRSEHDALRAERDEVRQSYCSLMEAYRGGNGRVTANKLGWGYLFEEDKPCQ